MFRDSGRLLCIISELRKLFQCRSKTHVRVVLFSSSKIFVEVSSTTVYYPDPTNCMRTGLLCQILVDENRMQ
jgi:hypothetical protein